MGHVICQLTHGASGIPLSLSMLLFFLPLTLAVALPPSEVAVAPSSSAVLIFRCGFLRLKRHKAAHLLVNGRDVYPGMAISAIRPR